MGEFSDKLSAMCSKELVLARRDPERMAEMIEALANVAGLAISIGSGGDAKVAQELTDGFENYMAECATGRRQSLATFLSQKT
jgi:hypothetical protein